MSINPSQLLLAAALICTTPAWAALNVNANRTVTDTVTSLVWDQCAYGLTETDPTCASGTALLADWPTALKAATTANAANYKGFNDWRLPNVKELESIVKIDTFLPAIDSVAFPNTLLGGEFGPSSFWSSTSVATDPRGAYAIEFSNGYVYTVLPDFFDPVLRPSYVRLVRSGQPLAPFDPQDATPLGPVAIPTLSEWGMILLTGLVALFGLGRARRRAQDRR